MARLYISRNLTNQRTPIQLKYSRLLNFDRISDYYKKSLIFLFA